MSSAEFERFLSDLQRDPELMEEFRSLAEDAQIWVRWASAKGYDITPEEAAELEETYSEISDDDLEQAAGGWSGDGGGG
jgi:predicted ribosomally synthesized peptide with nif11-like leader